MKTACIYLLVLVFVFPSLAQEKLYEELYESRELPAVVLKNAGEEFSVYYPDSSSPDSRVVELERAFISYKLETENGKLKSYLFLFKLEDGYLSATFNERGKLTSVVEKFKNVRLPELVRESLAKEFPEWSLIKDKFLYVQKYGSVKIKEYKIIMKKGKKIRRVVLNEEGVIIKGKF